MTDREKARDLGNQSAALARSIADVLNDTLDALETAEKERDRWRARRDRWRAVACNVKDGTQAAEARVAKLEAALRKCIHAADTSFFRGPETRIIEIARAALAKEDT